MCSAAFLIEVSALWWFLRSLQSHRGIELKINLRCPHLRWTCPWRAAETLHSTAWMNELWCLQTKQQKKKQVVNVCHMLFADSFCWFLPCEYGVSVCGPHTARQSVFCTVTRFCPVEFYGFSCERHSGIQSWSSLEEILQKERVVSVSQFKGFLLLLFAAILYSTVIWCKVSDRAWTITDWHAGLCHDNKALVVLFYCLCAKAW